MSTDEAMQRIQIALEQEALHLDLGNCHLNDNQLQTLPESIGNLAQL